jgi:hypothetical protein
MPLSRFLPLLAVLPTFLIAKPLVVSPGGPLKTPQAALEQARALRRAGAQGPLTIQFRAGVYELAETLVLTPQDSDLVFEAAPDERVVLSGGRAVRGWTKGEHNVWTALVEGRAFRQLFVNGSRAQRARTPNEGFFRADGPSSLNQPYRLKFRGQDVRKSWAGSGAEAVVLLAWAYVRMPITTVDEAAHVATLAGNPRASNREDNARYWIENTPDALDAPGEWYLDRARGVVSYKPLDAENPPAGEIVAPALHQLVRLEGQPAAGQFVRRVVFRGIEFSYADWDMDPQGIADTQAASFAGAAFDAAGAEDCHIEHCQFTHLGEYAIAFGRGCKRNHIVANEIFDIGAGGVKIGEAALRENEAEQNCDNFVIDNHIHNLGHVAPSAIGAWVVQSSRNTVAHNHIHDLPYSAISVGWTWGYGPTQAQGNRIEYNHLHDIGQNMLSDLGAIYTLGVQPGTVIRHNLIHDVQSFTYGGWGIYPDEGSSHMLIEDNVVYACKSAGFHQHYGRENIVRNNIFAFNRETQLMRSRTEPHVSFTFENNIVYFDDGRLLGHNWKGDGFRMDRNVYWDTRGLTPRFSAWSWDEWRARGKDLNSVIADPLFVNAASGDFRLRPESPALKLGFRPIDLREVGPRVAPGPQL